MAGILDAAVTTRKMEPLKLIGCIATLSVSFCSDKKGGQFPLPQRADTLRSLFFRAVSSHH